MSSLNAIGEISYNGVTFDATTKTRITATPIYDAANRTVVYVSYKFQISAHVHMADLAIGSQIQAKFLREKLTHPGGIFVYTGRGFGNLNINTSVVRDVRWGPKPQLVEYYPIGLDIWKVEFSIEVCIPDCENARYEFGVLEWNFEAVTAIDRAGWTTITYTGHLVVPMTRMGVGIRTLPDCADNYRDLVVPKQQEGFVRETQNYQLSLDKTRIDYTIVDKQFPGDLPNECLDAEGIHTVDAVEGTSLQKWNSSFQCTYTMAPTAKRSLALDHFLVLIQSRLPESAVLVSKFGMKEPIYKNPNVISLWCTVVLTSTLETFLTDCHLLKEIPEIDPAKWKEGEGVKKSQHERGLAGVTFGPDCDYIVDLCGDEGLLWLQARRAERLGAELPELEELEKKESWLGYDNKLTYEEKSGSIRLKALPIRKPEQNKSLGTTGLELSTAPDLPVGTNVEPPVQDNGDEEKPTTHPPDIIQDRGGTWTVVMEGYGIRVGERVPIPKLTAIGEAKCTEAADAFYEPDIIVARYGDVPAFRSRWRIPYILDRKPKMPLPVLYNPMLDY